MNNSTHHSNVSFTQRKQLPTGKFEKSETKRHKFSTKSYLPTREGTKKQLTEVNTILQFSIGLGISFFLQNLTAHYRRSQLSTQEFGVPKGVQSFGTF